VRDAVVGNVGTIISFRVGAPDADLLQKEFEPIFEANDLVNLDNYHVYVKMSIDGVTCPAFSATTLPRSATKYENTQAIIDFSRQNYSRHREYVEQQIEQISDLPKLDEIMTKAQKKLVPKIPPKIGDTYYREVQNPGDVRWYLGGGTADQPLTEETVQEKLIKTEEKATIYEEKLENWQKERLAALEPSTGDETLAHYDDGNNSAESTQMPIAAAEETVEGTAIAPVAPSVAPVRAKGVADFMTSPATARSIDHDTVLPLNPTSLDKTPQTAPVASAPIVNEVGQDIEDDKAKIMESLGKGETKELNDGEVVQL